jgi:hypothetical protein
MRHHLRSLHPILVAAAGCLVAAAATFVSTDAQSAGSSTPPREVTPSGTGFAGVYGQLPANQAEFISSTDAIKSAAVSGAPTLIWETLEHGEKVECLDCISVVAPLLYDGNAKNREIAAWWLRRRIFGVFGPGEVYEQTLNTLASDASPVRRAYAAYALGEFFAAPGITACATALVSDTDASVRAAAASALGRLNDDGAGALTAALSDADAAVRLASLTSAGRINVFSGAASVSALTVDSSAEVRRRAIEVLDQLGATVALVPVVAAAQKDSDARVRIAACHALGTFGDQSARPVLQNLAQHDPSGLVRDMAQIALLEL